MKITNNKNLINILKEKSLLFYVFVTGACVLALEVAATRILSPYYGNTIFSVSSILGIVLMALSFGYYYGGKLADKHPDESLFYKIILFSGLNIFLMQFVIANMLPLFAYSLSLTRGPVIVSLLLFALPSFLLGMLSPFAIKLTEKLNPKMGIGQISGEVFFASTFGSIFGSFVTGFFLIPNLGLDVIMISVALILCMIGLLGVSFSGIGKKKVRFNIILAIIFFSLSLVNLPYKENVLFVNEGLYSRITVYDDLWNGKKTRFLLQDRSLSSGKFLDSTEMAFEYTKYYQLYKLFQEKPGNALFIGGGAYITPHVLSNEVEGISIDIVEIEPELFDIAEKYFDVDKNRNIENHITDGRHFLENTDKRYDIIFSDVYASIYSVPSHFTTKEFFTLAKERLSDDGIIILNIVGSLSRSKLSFLWSQYKTFKEVFPNAYVFAVESPTQLELQNTIFLGVKNPSDEDLRDMLKSNMDPFISGLHDNLVVTTRFNLDKYKIFSDNFSPSDYYSGLMLANERKRYDVFEKEESLSLIEQQVTYGERSVGSDPHKKVKEFIKSETSALSDEVIVQNWREDEMDFENIIARINPEKDKRIILGTHYDTKSKIPGANDGASGTAVLLEILRVLRVNEESLDLGIDIIFFDGEEGLEGKVWKAYGSSHYAEKIADIYKDKKPEAAIIIDMVCDKDLQIYKERNSNIFARDLNNRFFEMANALYPETFRNTVRHEIQDDHVALNEIGIPAILLVDFDYRYFHTPKDTPDKCLDDSLEKVGNSILKYIYTYSD